MLLRYKNNRSIAKDLIRFAQVSPKSYSIAHHFINLENSDGVHNLLKFVRCQFPAQSLFSSNNLQKIFHKS